MEVLHGVQYMAIQVEEHVAAGILLAEGVIRQCLYPGYLRSIARLFCFSQKELSMASASSSAPEVPD